MNSLEQDEELAKLSVPEIIEHIAKLTEEYSASLTRLTHELLIRAMQQSK